MNKPIDQLFDVPSQEEVDIAQALTRQMLECADNAGLVLGDFEEEIRDTLVLQGLIPKDK